MTPSGIEPATFRHVAQGDSAKNNVLVCFVTNKGCPGKTTFLTVAPNIVSIIIAVLPLPLPPYIQNGVSVHMHQAESAT